MKKTPQPTVPNNKVNETTKSTDQIGNKMIKIKDVFQEKFSILDVISAIPVSLGKFIHL